MAMHPHFGPPFSPGVSGLVLTQSNADAGLLKKKKCCSGLAGQTPSLENMGG